MSPLGERALAEARKLCEREHHEEIPRDDGGGCLTIVVRPFEPGECPHCRRIAAALLLAEANGVEREYPGPMPPAHRARELRAAAEEVERG